jgi:hypothetical protein
LGGYYLYPALTFTEAHEHGFDVLCAQLDTLLRTKRPEGIRKLSMIPVAIFTGQSLPWVAVFDAPRFREGQLLLGFGPSALTGNRMGFLFLLGVLKRLFDFPCPAG